MPSKNRTRVVEQREISHEVWDLAVRLWAKRLHLKYIITADDRNIIICVGAVHRVLVEDRRRVMLDAGLEFDERTLPNMYKDPPCDIAWRLHLPGGCPIDES